MKPEMLCATGLNSAFPGTGGSGERKSGSHPPAYKGYVNYN